ncbi:MAG: tyrosine recombinase [Spirochaetales bacterium]|nr:tyrosine recombinase [Spirochaetales bacterium]
MKVDEYLEYLTRVRNYSDETVRAYGDDLAKFSTYIREEELDYLNLDNSCARRFISSLSSSGLAKSSLNRIMSTMKGYYRFLILQKYTEVSPFENVRSLKNNRYLPDYMFEKEVENIIGLAGAGFFGIRDRFILELLYSTGCRVSETASISVSDIDFKDRSVRVSGKGGKERIVYLGQGAIESLAEYLPLRSIRADKEDADAIDALLLNHRGRRITPRGIALIVDKYVRQSGITKKISPHSFRHSFATHLIDHGADIRVVQEMLGHESLSTTQIYTHMGIDKLRDVYRRAHPHAEKRNGA